MRLRVSMVAAECEPWAKTGGLADVVDALARALGRLGDEIDGPVEVFLPRYRTVPAPSPDALLGEAVVRVPDPRAPAGTTELTVIDVAANGYRLRLVDHPAAFDRAHLYGDAAGDYADNAWRFGLFCRAVLETIRTADRPPDVLHLHDWHGGAAAVFRDLRYGGDPAVRDLAFVMTVHNLAYRGWTPNRALPQLGLRAGDGAPGQNPDGIDLLAAGIEGAEIVNTVSPGFAAEARTPALGMGLDGLLRSRGDRFIGIVNGLDTALWDPSTDAAIASTYSPGDRSGKAVCRADLLTRCGFDPADDAPVIGMVARLVRQKGFDLLAAAAPALLDRGARLIVLGSGQPALADPFRALADASPDRVAFLEVFDRAMARRIYAGADVFAMPSRYEPCGQGQMIAMRYGTPPIVRRTGGLADTVVDETAHPGEGTGFVFEEPTSGALVEACDRAFTLRAQGGSAWRGLVDRGMAVDFDWATGPAPAYVAAYRRAIAVRSGGDV